MESRGRKRRPGPPEEDVGTWRIRERTFQQRQLMEKALLHFREGRPLPLDWLLINTLPHTGLFNESSPVNTVESIGDREELRDLLSSVKDILELRAEAPGIEGAGGQDAAELPFSAPFSASTAASAPTASPTAAELAEVYEYWDALQCYLEDRLGLASGGGAGSAAPPTTAISNPQIIEEVHALIRGKDYEGLCKLELLVRSKLRLPDADAEYWSGMLSELRVAKLKGRLEECHRRLLQHRRAEEGAEDVATFIRRRADARNPPEKEPPSTGPLGRPVRWDDSKEAVDWYASMRAISFYRNERLFVEEAVGLPPRQYPWASQHTPIKPRYHNWVFLRIEWTKYNQAHYNSQNPPPPTPQGYCFNIFYPHRVEPARTPTYITEPDPIDSENWQLLRFIGGPPYEDLVFRIPAHRWELGHRAGFKCSFERSTLVLKFRFRKMLYRR